MYPVERQPGGRSARSRKEHQVARQFAVDPFVVTEVAVAEIEERLPVDEPAGSAFAAPQIGGIRIVRILRIVEDECKEGRASVRTEIEPVAGTHLRMSEAVGRDRELDGDQRLFVRIPEQAILAPIVHPVEAESVAEDVVDAVLPDRQREEFVEDDPLIVPADLTLRLLEDSVCGFVGIGGVRAQPIDHGVVKLQHGQMKLTDEHVFVVAAVCDDGVVICIARQIESCGSFAGDAFRSRYGFYAKFHVSGTRVVEFR